MVDDADLRDVVRREKRLLEPAVRAAAEQVQALLHPDFVEFGSSGRVWDRAGVVAAVGHAPDVAGEAADFAATVLADGVVLLTYRIGGARGSLRTSIWVTDPEHGWRLRFHQGTPTD